MKLKDMKINENLGIRETHSDSVSDSEIALESGIRLANESVANGGWAEYFKNDSDITAICNRPASSLRKDRVVAYTARMLENAKRRILRMDETTRAATMGGYVDQLLPAIRAGVPADPLLELVSFQPLAKVTGNIVYLDYRYGSNKGSISRGQKMFDAIRGYQGGSSYSSERVDREALSISGANVTGNLAYGSGGIESGGGVRPSTVVVTYVGSDGGDMVLQDNNGLLVKNTTVSNSANTVSSGTINYATGAIAIVNSANVAAGSAAVSYEFDGEGASNAPLLDIVPTLIPMTARARRLRTRFTREAEFDAANEMGLDLAVESARLIGDAMTSERAREVIEDMWLAAGPAAATFSRNVGRPTGVTNREYAQDLQGAIADADELMLRETQKKQSNWLCIDTRAYALFSTIGAPHFAQWQQAQLDTDTIGPRFVGVWGGPSGKRVFVDPKMHELPGASPLGNILMGCKSNSDFRDAGYVVAPYQALEASPQIMLDDMVNRRGFLTRYARKVINPLYFRRVSITN